MSKLSDLKARMEKRAYGRAELLGDLLGAGAAGFNVISPDVHAHFADRRQDVATAEVPSLGAYRDARRASNASGAAMVGSMPAAAAVSALMPVNGYRMATPLAALAGSFGADALMNKYAPGASTAARGLAASGGALAGRMALRGYDAVKKRGTKKKDSGEKTSSAYENGGFAALRALRLAAE